MGALKAIEGRDLVMDDGARVVVPDFLTIWPVDGEPGAHGLGFVGRDGQRRGLQVRTGQPSDRIEAGLSWLTVHHIKHGPAPATRSPQ